MLYPHGAVKRPCQALRSEEKLSVLREAESAFHQALQLLASANLPDVVGGQRHQKLPHSQSIGSASSLTCAVQ